MRLDSFFSGALCALSGGRLPEALFMVFLMDSKGAKVCFVSGAASFVRRTLARSVFSWFSDWSPKVRKCVNLVDLVKSFLTSMYLHNLASIQPRVGLSKFADN